MFSAAAMAPTGGYGGMAMGLLPLSALGAFGMVLGARTDKRKPRKNIVSRILWTSGFAVLTVWLLFTIGCGGGGTTPSRQHASTVTVMVTGMSGSISHTTPVTLTIQ
jgi:hypothetical protein